MSDFPIQNITIYHKTDDGYERYVKEASYRNNINLNHNRDGSNSSENATVRIFDIDGYNSTWFVSLEDVVVNQEVGTEIDNAPFKELSNIYGKNNVHKVTSINKLVFDDEDIEELNHIKLGCI